MSLISTTNPFLLLLLLVALVCSVDFLTEAEARRSTTAELNPKVHFQVESIHQNYNIYLYREPYRDFYGNVLTLNSVLLTNNSARINISSTSTSDDEIIFWEFKTGTVTSPAPFQLKLSCEAEGYVTKWKFNSDKAQQSSSLQPDNFLDMGYRVNLTSRPVENLFPNNKIFVSGNGKRLGVRNYKELAELTIVSFHQSFKSASIDCVNVENESLRTRLYIFQKSDKKLNPFERDITTTKGYEPSIVPCQVHDPHLIPSLCQKIKHLKDQPWRRIQYSSYDWKLGFRLNNNTSTRTATGEGDQFQCQIHYDNENGCRPNKPTKSYKFNYDSAHNLSTAGGPYLLENTKVQIQVLQSKVTKEWKFSCNLLMISVDNGNGGRSSSSPHKYNAKLKSIRFEPCVSPQYCKFSRRDIKDKDSLRYENCTSTPSSCELTKKPNNTDNSKFDIQGKVTCVVEFQSRFYSFSDYYFRGMQSQNYSLLSRSWSRSGQVAGNETVQLNVVTKSRSDSSSESKVKGTTLAITCTTLNFFALGNATKLSLLTFDKTEEILEVVTYSQISVDGRTQHATAVAAEIVLDPSKTPQIEQVQCHVLWFNATTDNYEWLAITYPVINDGLTTTTTTTTKSKPPFKPNTTTNPSSTINSNATLTTHSSSHHGIVTAVCTTIALLILIALIGFGLHHYFIITWLCCSQNSTSILESHEMTSLELLDTKITFPPRYVITSKDFSVDYSEILSEGQFSKLYQGWMLGGQLSLLVKVNKTGGDAAEIASLLNDARMRITAGEGCGCITLILGAYFDHPDGKVYIVMKPSTMRNIREFLTNQNIPLGHSHILNLPPNEMIPIFYTWLKGVSNGLEFLHGKNIVHGNIAAENILVCFQNTDTVSITGFSHAQQLTDQAGYCVNKSRNWNSSGAGWETSGWKWMPMESLRYMEFSKESDIWSFGVLIWEIFSLGRIPYRKLGYLNLSMKFIQKLEFGLRLPQPQLAPRDIYIKMEACWSRFGKDRPKLQDLSRCFHENISKFTNDYANLE